ncbi:hypothetical protein DPMN_111588 [Dreissena polymorpha]|uniref:Uncharacterized protein n=1 Tax=Dreissena polymorpha TaxID=45954 RepID=A0A9D4KEQ7_DREPO|nr:hypothetical protein DPMN_111588 [Dreissena polymorpha]
MTVPNQASFRRLTVASMGSSGPKNIAVMFRTYSLVLCSVWELQSSLRRHKCSNVCILHYVSA